MSKDERLSQILEMIERIAALDLDHKLPVSKNNDRLDAISLGLNMLSEELKDNTVEKEQLDKTNKKLEQFAYSTAHDLKSPLNSLSGLVYLLANTVSEENSDAQDIIVKIASTVDKMKNLVHGILEYSVVADPTELKSEVNLKEIVNEIIETDRYEDNITIRVDHFEKKIEFNRTILLRILRNLISNAVKYCDKPNCEIKIKVTEKENKAVISVIDNGPGIPFDEKDKIFELFHKYDPEGTHESQGIGLATVKNLLQSTGEDIWVESKEGKGSNFYFTIGVNDNIK
ncbi:HAMP domain-containing sensor histidine kinase [Mangrovivirga sp. M17]|uniref:histidine kinase n=1 Tax=Mangrovivirga halotolerans TaxID=2993936 RepID=A0ABT3RQS6_9BACT|nr:HAMP domain-containing sensor histidine kinase [Mangrovivirga halotolerans]MCX2743913.1 HAMP domain-containing sensor histidine kinase [Mangrovivirga halotolerans]